jgi:hypothetical protein
LAKRGVIVVSTAYRLGQLGFFSHPALDNGPREPVANFGLLDIEQAFRWVKQNLANSRQYVMELGNEIHIVKPHDDVLCLYLGPKEK